MNLIKGLGLLSVLLIVTGSCFDPPEFPNEPHIEFENIVFKGRPFPENDSLILSINFKDGDGDLGFYFENTADISYPYNNANFYQENNGELLTLSTVTGSVGNIQYDLLDIPDPTKGSLVVFRTRQKPGYSFLPAAETCNGSDDLKYYEYLDGPYDPTSASDGRRLLIAAADLPAIDPDVKLVDSIKGSDGKVAYYQIQDTLYYTSNPNHYNIEVEFLVKDPAAPGGFREFDWHEEYCTTFNGRFPVFSDKQSSIDGTLIYAMTSIGFEEQFSIKTLKLRVSIKDRKLNKSNVIETPEFTLLP
ncbi:MAG: hypothetical protein WA874_08495 [Chryseosolibacter sp.]